VLVGLKSLQYSNEKSWQIESTLSKIFDKNADKTELWIIFHVEFSKKHDSHSFNFLRSHK
jgi:hypothetical protein